MGERIELAYLADDTLDIHAPLQRTRGCRCSERVRAERQANDQHGRQRDRELPAH